MYHYSTLRDRAEAYYRSVFARGCKLANEAGIPGEAFKDAMSTYVHNAMCDVENNGQGWAAQVTDRAKLRRAHYLMNTQCFAASRLVSALYSRCPRKFIFAAPMPTKTFNPPAQA